MSTDPIYETFETAQPWVIYSYLTTDAEADANGGEGQILIRCAICGVREVCVIAIPDEPLHTPPDYRHPQRAAFLAAHQHPGVNRNPLSWEQPLANPAALRDGDLEDVLGVVVDRAQRGGEG